MKTKFVIRQKKSRSGRPMTVVEVTSNRPIPPAIDSGHVKTIVIRRDSSRPAVASS